MLNWKKAIGFSIAVLGAAFVGMNVIAKKQKPKSEYADRPEEQNPMKGKKVVFVEDENDPINADGKNGHLEAVGESYHKPTFYEKYVKRGLDMVLSFGGMVVLSPLYAVAAIAIKCDDPGPALFKQKRVAQSKGYFELMKFRSMKLNTPKNVPTHMLDNPEQYLLKSGKLFRKLSIDELPQLWNIFIGNMSVIGPRPALWNQDYLTAERDKYSANDIKPGLTGLAQAHGRDELEIPDKAKLDGEYAAALKKSSWSGFKMDVKVFIDSVKAVIKSDGVVEGGTGAMERENIDKEVFENVKDITVSIVTYNSADEIDILMNSIASSTSFDNLTVFVVDNASKDNTVNHIRNKYNWVRIIESKKNLGFGAGHNLVINNVNSKFHLIVNPDISICSSSIETAIDYMEKNTNVSVVTPFVMNLDGSQQFLPKKNPTMKYMFGGMFETKLSICKKWRDEYTLRNEIINNPREVEFCTGAFMITRTNALHKVGGFDERYFLHFEDADLTRELRKVGKAIYNPNVKVTHKWHRENKKINKSFWVALKSMFIYMMKWRGNNA